VDIAQHSHADATLLQALQHRGCVGGEVVVAVVRLHRVQRLGKLWVEAGVSEHAEVHLTVHGGIAVHAGRVQSGLVGVDCFQGLQHPTAWRSRPTLNEPPKSWNRIQMHVVVWLDYIRGSAW